MWRIGGSPPAPRLEVVSAPNDWAKPVTEAPTERNAAYRRFFQQLLDKFREANPGETNAHKASGQSWLSTAAGRTGFAFAWVFKRDNRFSVELYIDRGDRDLNKQAFDALWLERAEIEAELGMPLSWERLDKRRACRIASHTDGSITMAAADLAMVREFALAAMPKFRTVLAPRIRGLG